MEFLAVLVIVSILLAVLLPTISRSRESGQRLACLNNVRQLALGSILYSEEDIEGSYVGSKYGENDLNWLYFKQVPKLSAFLCPSTRNSIRPDSRGKNLHQEEYLVDLADTALYTDTPGVSYRVLPYFGRKAQGVATAKTQLSVPTYTHANSTFGMKGWMPGPSQVWLYVDADKNRPGVKGSLPNWPDNGDNHGVVGGNVAFCDGHAEFIRQREYFYRFELSQDEGLARPNP